MIHLGPELNKAHFYTRVQDLTKISVFKKIFWFIQNLKMSSVTYIESFFQDQKTKLNRQKLQTYSPYKDDFATDLFYCISDIKDILSFP